MAAIGYLVGSVKIRGLSLGTSGILLVALIFGHFGIEAPPMIQNIGLISFVTAVGLMAGPNFFRNFRGNAVSYLVLGVAITGAGALTCLILIRLTGLAPDLALGIMAGALTSTPGLAAAMEATGSSMASLGYGIAYPFGVISVVLFVQLMPKWLKADVKEESQKLSLRRIDARKTAQIRLITCDSRGFFGFALAIVLGLLIGQISIPLPGGVSFAMGTSGGPLFAGLILGYFGRIGKVDVSVNKEVLVTMREFGLAMFLIGVGSHAGVGLWRVLREQGLLLFLYGAVIAVVPMLVGSILARKVFRMNVLDMLGSICGGMTSTPALGTLIQVSGTDDVAASYAATYPVALAMVVLCAQLMGVYLK
ncbi:MAG: permease [Clostridia bacterium]|nr:permease [Clostridia bacterium]